jgi:predicted nuclease of restriction endonuclease-like (RecB) superfamily
LANLSEKSILPPLAAEIGWSKNIVIMQKCKDPAQREFYIKMTKRYGWTKDVLINNIENKAFEKYLTNQTNFDETVYDAMPDNMKSLLPSPDEIAKIVRAFDGERHAKKGFTSEERLP